MAGGNKLAVDLLAESAMRSRYLPSVSAEGCGWLLLLDLYRHEPQQISSLCYGSGYPYTTALRHLTDLTEQQLVSRSDSKSDGRAVLCRLTQTARDAVTDYLAAVSERRVAA